jgi:transcriptional regulator with XRE-family HTH domain
VSLADSILASKEIRSRIPELKGLLIAPRGIPHRREVGEAVRQLRSTLGLTQQAFAVELNTALTTIARWETVRSPRGSTLGLLAQLAEKSGRPDLAGVFRKELMVELALVLRSQFRYSMRHQRQAVSGEEALISVVRELGRLSQSFEKPHLTRGEMIRIGKEIGQHVKELEALTMAAETIDAKGDLNKT